MTFSQMITISVVAAIYAVLALPSGAHALPKGTKWQNCAAQNLNTRFGSSCMSQADQDIMSGKSYTHVLFCGSVSMLSW